MRGTPIPQSDHPSATDTYLYGIDGNNIVGWYSDASGDHSFKFDVSNFIPLDNPLGTSTHLHGIDGDNIVGSYIDSSGIRHGTLYDGTWHDRSSSTFKNDLYGIDGPDMVGYSRLNGTAVDTQGTLYDGAWTNFNYPGATSTSLHGVSGGNMVGAYTDGSGDIHGVFRDDSTSTWTTLDHPTATSNTFLFDIDGDLVVGGYGDSSGEHGLLYDHSNSSWETLDVDVPGATNTFVHGIDGANLVGFYTDSSGNFHGFTASVSVPFANPSPEPSTLSLSPLRSGARAA